jgi:hypothetical protein
MLPVTTILRIALLARIAIVGLTFFTSWPSAAQPNQKLFESKDHLPRADESRLLDSEESAAVAHMRGNSTYVKDVKVLKKLNLNALYGKAITIGFPDGEEITYVGEMVGSSDPSIRSWVGVAPNHNGHLAISIHEGSVEGDAAYRGRGYVVRSLAKGRKFLFAEIKSPLGLHEGEPLSNFPVPSASQPRGK